MDHQIKHDADIDAARWIRREPVRLDEPRFGRDALEISENGIETFDVADLQNAVARLRELDQVCSLTGIVGHRFLNQQMLACPEKRFGKIVMGGGRSDDAQSVAG